MSFPQKVPLAPIFVEISTELPDISTISALIGLFCGNAVTRYWPLRHPKPSKYARPAAGVEVFPGLAFLPLARSLPFAPLPQPHCQRTDLPEAYAKNFRKRQIPGCETTRSVKDMSNNRFKLLRRFRYGQPLHGLLRRGPKGILRRRRRASGVLRLRGWRSAEHGVRRYRWLRAGKVASELPFAEVFCVGLGEVSALAVRLR